MTDCARYHPHKGINGVTKLIDTFSTEIREKNRLHSLQKEIFLKATSLKK